MSSQAFRLDESITAVEYASDGRTTLRVLPSGLDLLACAGEAPPGMIRVTAGGHSEYCVFSTDLEERSTVVSVDLRKPAATAAAVGANAVRWAC